SRGVHPPAQPVELDPRGLEAIEDRLALLRHRADRVGGTVGMADGAHHHDLERHAEATGDGGAEHDAAPGHRVHHGIVGPYALSQYRGELACRRFAVLDWHGFPYDDDPALYAAGKTAV